jgi:hypothetical protein
MASLCARNVEIARMLEQEEELEFQLWLREQELATVQMELAVEGLAEQFVSQTLILMDDESVEVVKVKKPATDHRQIYVCNLEIAHKLELEEEMKAKVLREHELASIQMKMTLEGRAWHFVHELLVECEKLQTKYPTVPIRPVANDDLYYMTLNLLEKQESFFASNVDVTVDLGFH